MHFCCCRYDNSDDTAATVTVGFACLLDCEQEAACRHRGQDVINTEQITGDLPPVSHFRMWTEFKEYGHRSLTKLSLFFVKGAHLCHQYRKRK